jgi:hypothetical protein
MPQVVAEVWVPLDPQTTFALSQTTGDLRLRWDPFIRRQYLIGADQPGKGVRTYTKSRIGPRMISEYSSYRPPVSVGMTMVEGPWFFEVFGGGWRFTSAAREDVAGTTATWKYTFSIRPRWLRFIANPLGHWLLGREIRRRIAAFAIACQNPDIIAAIQAPTI